MITRTQTYQSSDGSFHATLEAAQKAELKEILFPSGQEDKHIYNSIGATKVTVESFEEIVAGSIMNCADRIVDALTTKSNSIVKARRVNGGTKKRTPKHIAEQHTLPLTTEAS